MNHAGVVTDFFLKISSGFLFHTLYEYTQFTSSVSILPEKNSFFMEVLVSGYVMSQKSENGELSQIQEISDISLLCFKWLTQRLIFKGLK